MKTRHLVTKHTQEYNAGYNWMIKTSYKNYIDFCMDDMDYIEIFDEKPSPAFIRGMDDASHFRSLKN